MEVELKGMKPSGTTLMDVEQGGTFRLPMGHEIYMRLDTRREQHGPVDGYIRAASLRSGCVYVYRPDKEIVHVQMKAVEL